MPDTISKVYKWKQAPTMIHTLHCVCNCIANFWGYEFTLAVREEHNQTETVKEEPVP